MKKSIRFLATILSLVLMLSSFSISASASIFKGKTIVLGDESVTGTILHDSEIEKYTYYFFNNNFDDYGSAKRIRLQNKSNYVVSSNVSQIAPIKSGDSVEINLDLMLSIYPTTTEILIVYNPISHTISVSPEYEDHSFYYQYDEKYHWLKCFDWINGQYCDQIRGKEKHTWGAPFLTIAPTMEHTGTKTYTCIFCEATREKTVPVLTSTNMYLNKTAIDTGLKLAMDDDSLAISWGKVEDADGYMLYASYCGTDKAPKLVATKNDSSICNYFLDKLDGKKIDKSKPIKAYVVAYRNENGKRTAIARSITLHIAGEKSKYTNPASISASEKNIYLSVGEKRTISSTIQYESKKKKPLPSSHSSEKRYRSSCNKVATVDKNGVITAKAKGSSTVLIIAQNGVQTKVNVIVK